MGEGMYPALEAESTHARHLAEAAAEETSTPPISVDVSFLFSCAYMVFFMQLGFAAVRSSPIFSKALQLPRDISHRLSYNYCTRQASNSDQVDERINLLGFL